VTRAYVLDPATRATLGLVDQSWERLSYTRRYTAMDTFELVINRSRLWASELETGRLLYLPDEGDLVFLVEQVESEAEGSTRNEAMTVTGRSLEGIAMAERLVLPPPGESHDRVTAVPAETAIKHYLRANAADLADAARQLPGLVVAADAARGATVTVAGRYQAVLDLVREIGLLAGLGWEVTYDPGSDAFVFDVLEGADRSASVFFDFAFQTLERWTELASVLDAKTLAVVAGQGEGADRDVVVRWAGSEPTGFDRREAFLDARDVEAGATTILEQRGDAYLAAAGAETRLEAGVHQYGAFRYREHWDVGDLVLVRNAERATSYTARIVEVEKAFERSAAAPTVTATLGRPFPTLASQASTSRTAATADGAVSGAAAGGAPVGSIVLWPAAAPPADWLVCDGASLLRSAYPALFAVLGTTYGAADGTHFSLPDYRGRVPVGLKASDADFDTLGETTGAKTATPSAHAVTQPAAHTVTQPSAHANHAVTQPSAHPALAHSAHAGADVSSHAGAAVAAHSSHNHELPFIIDDTHAISSINQTVFGTGASRTRRWTGSVSSASGSYAVAQSESVGLSAHSVTQPSDHAVTQPSAHSDHAAQGHSGTGVDAHSAHTGTSVSAHTGAAVGDHAAIAVVQPSVVANYIIRAA
jgi:microcystin-dependent protein